MDNLVERITTETEWVEISMLLDDVTSKDIPSLKKVIPFLLKSESWVLQADIIDIIGVYGIRGFEDEISMVLTDESRNEHLRFYALRSLYDLNHKKSHKILKEYLEDPCVSLRLAAMCLYYIETKDKGVLTKITQIVCRKNCNYLHQVSVIRIFSNYIDTSKNEEIVGLFLKICSNARNKVVEKELRELKISYKVK